MNDRPADGVRGTHGSEDGDTEAAVPAPVGMPCPLAAPGAAAGQAPVPPRGQARPAADFTQLGDLLGDQSIAVHARSEPTAAAAHRGGPSGTATGADLAAAIALAWPHVVGEEVAANSQPVRVKQSRLTVAVSSTVWAQTLQFMEQTIIAGLNDRLGSPLIERIAFRHAGWQEQPRRTSPRNEGNIASAAGGAPAIAGRTPTPAAMRGPEPGQAPFPQLTQEQQAALRSVEELKLEPQLTAKIIAAMRASFVRAQQDSVR